MIRQNVRSIALAIVCCIAVVACNGVRDSNRLKVLDETLQNYDVLTRWGMFNEMIPFLKPREGDPPIIDIDVYKGLHITRLEPLNQAMSDDNMEARIQNRIQYYWDDSQVVRTLTDSQLWWYDMELERWFLEGTIPTFAR